MHRRGMFAACCAFPAAARRDSVGAYRRTPPYWVRTPATLGVLAGVLFLACGRVERDSTEASRSSEIVGGTVDFGDPEVFFLQVRYTTGQLALCSATLIGNRTLVTAAHCVDPNASIRAANGSDADLIAASEWISVLETRIHPGWRPTVSLDDDVAVALLERAPPVSKKPWNRASLSTYAGKPIRAVGYGISAKTGSDWGVKRTVALVINSVDDGHLYLGDGATTGICHGDSGGPTLHRFEDGVERLVGIHSYDANQRCTSGADVRIDAYASFIDAWLMEKEAPTCAADGMCRAGCAPIDRDCSPPDCAANGICALDECAVPDVDCVKVGQPCSSALQCASRECVGDPQHSATYCSRPCHARSECPDGMDCAAEAGICVFFQLPVAVPGARCVPGAAFCSGGTVCAGKTPAVASCSTPCAADSDCDAAASCAIGIGSVRYCRSPLAPASVSPIPPPARSGCATTGSPPFSLLLLALIGVGLRAPRRERTA